jgi:AcrR family transcriptional regulator
MADVKRESATRERILDAAATVLREHGIAGSTTKLMARAAGCSEALLYKHFSSTQDIYLAVLRERAGGFALLGEDAGAGEVRDALVDLVENLCAFYVQSFPMSASVMGSPALLVAWREGMTGRGAGPRSPVRMVERHLAQEVALGRLPADTDEVAVAALLVGAAFQQAFLAVFDGLDAVPDSAALAERLVDTVLPGL